MSSIEQNIPHADFLSRIISTIIPATVAECARRFSDLKTFCKGGNDSMDLVEKISDEIVAECDFNIDECRTCELGHIQNLKLDLHELYHEFLTELKYDLIEEFKDTIKSELRMEVFIELEKMKQGMGERKNASGTMQHFSIELPDLSVDGVDSVLGGFESIKSTLDFGPQSKSHTEIEQDLLENNPLFAQASKNLKRVRSGLDVRTIEEFIEAREGRFDDESIEKFRAAAAESKFTYESDNEEDVNWNKLLRAKLNTDL